MGFFWIPDLTLFVGMAFLKLRYRFGTPGWLGTVNAFGVSRKIVSTSMAPEKPREHPFDIAASRIMRP